LSLVDTWLYLVDWIIQLTLYHCPRLDVPPRLHFISLWRHSSVRTNECNR